MAKKKSGYDFYLKKCLLPVAPEKLTVKINNMNATLTLINEGQVNILRSPGLTDIEFECMIPQVKYPFATYKKGFKKASYFLDYFEKLKTDRKPFQFIVSRFQPNGKELLYTNIKVSMEDYKITEDAGEGFDLMVSIKLKQYREYGTKTVKVKKSSTSGSTSSTSSTTKAKATVTKSRSTETSPEPSSTQTYTVRDDDTLWGIAKKFYGDGSKWRTIYNANTDVIGSNPNVIKEGQVLTIPDAETAKNSSGSSTTTTSSASEKKSGEYKGSGGNKENPPFAVLDSSYSVLKTKIEKWSEAYGYYYANGGKSKGWKIMDGDNKQISI